jgi:hypothetical protein
MDSYFSLPHVSNSDLGDLDKYFQNAEYIRETYNAYRIGTLVDAVVTEPEKVDYFKLKIAGHDYTYTADEFEMAKNMLKVARQNTLVNNWLNQATLQKVVTLDKFEIEHEGVSFTLPVRTKWDLFLDSLNMGGDIKSTTATTQKQFEDACRYFNYTRQRAFYMDISGCRQDILIGISKVNYKIFLIPIVIGDDFYNTGKKQYQELAFKYWSLFGDVKINQHAAASY